MTAMRCPAPLIGNDRLAFFSSTAPPSAASSAIAFSCGVSTTAVAVCGAVGGGLSKTPTANRPRISLSTMSLRRLIGTLCCCTAVLSAPEKYLPDVMSCSWSSPSFAALTVECVPPQSDITQPRKPNCRLSTWLSRNAFSQA